MHVRQWSKARYTLPVSTGVKMTAVFTGRGYECHFLTPVDTGRGHGTGRVPVHTGSVYGALLHCETCVMSGLFVMFSTDHDGRPAASRSRRPN